VRHTVAPIVAAKAAEGLQGAGKAAQGEIYARRWTSVTGKGKKRREVQHEVHVNPLGIGLGVVAVGGAALLGAISLYALQLKASPTRVTIVKSAYVWPDGKRASAVYQDEGTARAAPSPAPTRSHVVPERGHYASSGTGEIQGRGYSKGALVWVVDAPAYTVTETAAWKQLSTMPGRKTFTIEQRQPFTMSELLPNPLENVGVGGKALMALSPITWPLLLLGKK
jgi:hypothetical protein